MIWPLRSSTLTDEEMARLDAVSDSPLRYPYWHQAAECGRSSQSGRPEPARAPLPRRRRLASGAGGRRLLDRVERRDPPATSA